MRADVEFAANDQVRLQFGDFLSVSWGSNDGVERVGELVGNKPKALDHPHVLPVFVASYLDAFGQFADRVARGACPGEIRTGRRFSDRRANLEPDWKTRAAHLVSFARSKSGTERNRHRLVSCLCRPEIRQPIFGGPCLG
jgi:hypothetical protein